MPFVIDAAGGLDLSGLPIINLLDPVNSQDATTKAYVDSVAQGLDVKASVRAATTANITLSATQTIDGVSLIAGDRVLVKNQTTASANGIYVVAAGAWTRSTDADTSADVTSGMFTFVTEGTINGDSGWVLTTNDPITLNTTALAFDQFSGAGQVVAGNGLSKTGNTLDVNVDDSTIEINTDILRVKDSGITAAKLATSAVDLTTTKVTGTLPVSKGGIGIATVSSNGILLGNGTGAMAVVAAGTANQVLRVGSGGGAPAFGQVNLASSAAVTGALPVVNGGTGATTNTGARTNLGAMGRFTTTNAAGTTTTVNHAFGTRDVQVEVYRTASPYDTVLATVERIDTNNVTVKFGSSKTAGEYTIVVVG